MSNAINDQHRINQKALEEFEKVWAELTPKEKTDQRESFAIRVQDSLPHTSAVLRSNGSSRELSEALHKDKQSVKIQKMISVQQQASLILHLLLQKGEASSFVNMGEVWKPSLIDFEAAFVDRAQEAFDTYQQLWSRTPVPFPKEGQDRILIQAAIPEFIPEARFFPSGYQKCLHLLHPDTVWIAWKYVREGENMGMAYNGLVWLGDRFKLFPKPWRMWKE